MESLINGALISAAVSVAVSLGVWRSFPQGCALRFAGALALAAGFVAAYSQIEPGCLVPTTNRHWLVWLVSVAAVLGPIGLASGVAIGERWTMTVIVALATALLLVPARTAPFRVHYVVLLTAGLVLWWNLVDGLGSPKNLFALTGSLIVTFLSGAGLVAYSSSLKISGIGVAGAGGLAGCALLATFARDVTLVRGSLGACSVVLWGMLLNAQLYDVPWPPLVLIASSPLVLWLMETGPLSRMQGRRASIGKAILVGLPHIGAWGLSIGGIAA